MHDGITGRSVHCMNWLVWRVVESGMLRAVVYILMKEMFFTEQQSLLCVCVCVCVCVCLCACLYVCTCGYTCTCACTYVHVSGCVRTCKNSGWCNWLSIYHMVQECTHCSHALTKRAPLIIGSFAAQSTF